MTGSARLDPLAPRSDGADPLAGTPEPPERENAARCIKGETLRRAVFRLDGGRCVMTGVPLDPDGGTWAWSVHHCIKSQELKRRGVSVKDPNLCILLSRRAHERHESRTETVPLNVLPERVVSAVRELGDWAVDQLRRYHPPAP